jgi:heme exporter protein D
MVYFESFGDNDFASIFPSVAEERREEEERRQTEMFLRLLDEMDHRREEEEPRVERQRVEHFVAVNGDGDIVRAEDPPLLNGKKIDRKKVHTLDDLPPVNDWELIFGPQPEPEPTMQVSSGLRVKDGKKFYRAYVPGEPGSFQWSGVSLEVLLILVLIGMVLLIVLLRGRKTRRKREAYNQKAKQAQENFERFIDAKVDKRVRDHLRKIKASDFK